MTGDGSTDGGHVGQESMGIVLLNDGLPCNEFFELEEIDYNEARDRESPDSQALLAGYDTAWRQRLPDKEHLLNMCGISLDGASVNSGKKKGLIMLMQQPCPWMVFMHGIAYVVDLYCGEAYEGIEYFTDVFDGLIRSLCLALMISFA